MHTNAMPSDESKCTAEFAHASSKRVSAFNSKMTKHRASLTLEKLQADFLEEEWASSLRLTLIDLSFQFPRAEGRNGILAVFMQGWYKWSIQFSGVCWGFPWVTGPIAHHVGGQCLAVVSQTANRFWLWCIDLQCQIEPVLNHASRGD